MEIFFKLLLCYLLGSVSGSILLGKFKGIDIREMGSGNAGGTNTFRIIGPLSALIVTMFDILKGYIAVKYIPLFLLKNINQNEYNLAIILIAFVCILGHVYPLYFQFKGGKGVGTLLGTLPIILGWEYTAICLVIWIVTLLLSGFVGLSSIIAGISLPIQYFYTESEYLSLNISPASIYCISITLFIIFTHRGNIKRMWEGNENRFDKLRIFNLFSHKS